MRVRFDFAPTISTQLDATDLTPGELRDHLQTATGHLVDDATARALFERVVRSPAFGLGGDVAIAANLTALQQIQRGIQQHARDSALGGIRTPADEMFAVLGSRTQALDAARKAMAAAALDGRSIPELEGQSQEQLIELGFGADATAQLRALISDESASQRLKLLPPPCGQSATELGRVLLGADGGEQIRTLTFALARGGAPVIPADVRAGRTAAALYEAMASSTERQCFRVEVPGHAYVIEVLPRASKDDPVRGIVHQSFWDQTHDFAYSGLEWRAHHPAPVDLAAYCAKLGSLADDKLTDLQRDTAYKELFIPTKLRNKGRYTELQPVAFAGKPFALETAQASLRSRLDS